MLQVRQAIAEALGIKKLSLVKLVKRLGSDRLMTSVGDSERLSQKSVSDLKHMKLQHGFQPVGTARKIQGMRPCQYWVLPNGILK